MSCRKILQDGVKKAILTFWIEEKLLKVMRHVVLHDFFLYFCHYEWEEFR